MTLGLESDFVVVEALRFLFDVLDYDTFTDGTGHRVEIIRVVDEVVQIGRIGLQRFLTVLSSSLSAKKLISSFLSPTC